MAAPSTIAGDVAVIGAATLENPIGVPGNPRAFDARTGKKLWEFNTVPQPGEPATRPGATAGRTARAPTCGSGTPPPTRRRDTIYMTIGSPAPNYYGGDRPGTNLFGNSLVAVDAQTGKYKWHFQTIHHDLWDWDLPAPPALFDVTVGRQDASGAGPCRQARPVVHPRPRDRRAGPRRRGTAGAERRRARRIVQPDPAVPGQAPAAQPRRVDARRRRHRRGHHARARRRPAARCGTRPAAIFNQGPFTPFFLHKRGRRRRARSSMPRHRRRQLGRQRGRSDQRPGLRQRPARAAGSAGSSASTSPRALQPRRQRTDQLYDRGSLTARARSSRFSAPISASTTRGPRRRARTCRAPAAVGPADRGRRQHRRDQLGGAARHHRGAARGQAAGRQHRQRRARP